MQDFQDELGATGQGAGVILGDRDETRLNNNINLTDGRDTEDVTTFQPAGNAKSYAYLLTAGTAAVKGFSAESPDVVRAQHAETLGKSRAKPILIVGKYGLAPGTEANFARTLANTRNCERSLTGVTTADATFALHSSGVLDGKSLHAVFGNAVPNLSEIQKLTFVNADPNAFRGVRAAGTLAVFSFGLGIDNAALSAGIAGLPTYNGRTVTVTGAALTGVNPSGTRQIAYDGAVDVPQLEAVIGAVDSFIVNGGNSGTYSANGGATFTLPISEGAFQTNLRNLGGQFAGVVVKGVSVGNTASGKTQAIAYTGNGPISVGGVAVDITTPESVATLVGRIKTANPSRTTLTGTGTIAKGSAGTITISGAGDNTVNGAYIGNGTLYTKQVGNTNLKVSFSNGNTEIEGGGAVYYRAAGGSYANPATTGFSNNSTDATMGGLAPSPALAFSAGTSASVNITLSDNASAGNVADLPVVGTGATSNSTPPGAPNGSANFKFYYPLNATPAAPTATGAGATITRAPLGISPDAIATTIQQATGADASFAYNVVTESGDGDWVDFDLDSPSGFHLALSVIHAQGVGATLGLVIETADADGAGAPVAGSIAMLHTFAPFGARAYDIVASKTPVKRLVRVRRTVVGSGEFIFALALAPRVA